MRQRKGIVICLLVLSILCAGYAIAEEDILFAGIPWGSSTEEVCAALQESGYATEDLTADKVTTRNSAISRQYYTYTKDDTSRFSPVMIRRIDKRDHPEFQTAALSINFTSDTNKRNPYLTNEQFMGFSLNSLTLSFACSNDSKQLYGIQLSINPEDGLEAYKDLKEQFDQLYSAADERRYKSGIFRYGNSFWLGKDNASGLLMGVWQQDEKQIVQIYFMSFRSEEMLLAAVENQ